MRLSCNGSSLTSKWVQIENLNQTSIQTESIVFEFPTEYHGQTSLNINFEIIEKGLALNQVEKRFEPEKTCSGRRSYTAARGTKSYILTGLDTCTCCCPCCLCQTVYRLGYAAYYAGEQAAQQVAKASNSGTVVARKCAALDCSRESLILDHVLPLDIVAKNRKGMYYCLRRRDQRESPSFNSIMPCSIGNPPQLRVDFEHSPWNKFLHEYSGFSFEKNHETSQEPNIASTIAKQVPEYQPLTVFDLLTIEKLNSHMALWAGNSYERNEYVQTR